MDNTTIKDYEIMAPVGSRESLMAAIQAGADSIYFGVEQLNMRSHSANHFTIDDLHDIAAICAEHGMKSYLTVNTIIYDEDVEFTIGKAHQIQDGKDVAIIANGDTVCLAIEAAKVLAGKGISARVLDMHTIKPLDVEAVTAAINDIGKIITVEDHNIINGLGSAVCEVAAEMGKGLVKRVGIQDQFGQSAPYERLLAMNGVTVEDIVAIAESMNA